MRKWLLVFGILLLAGGAWYAFTRGGMQGLWWWLLPLVLFVGIDLMLAIFKPGDTPLPRPRFRRNPPPPPGPP